MNSGFGVADEVAASDVTINNGAQFSFVDLGNGALPRGMIFIVINNTATNPIADALTDLDDGSAFTSNGNTYKVNYDGVDGNDVTLTVQ